MQGTNFIHQFRNQSDRELFFGPIESDERFVVFDDSWTLADIAVEAGLMPSKSQARKQGFDGDIPAGFTIGREKRKGHNKNFWILGVEK
jgi:hypothetical protein